MRYLDHVQGSNAAEWECEECGRIWISPREPKCVCVFPPVLTKRDFVRRFNLGEFGNRTMTWDCIDTLMQAYGLFGQIADADLIHIRNRIAGGRTWYNVPMKYVADVYGNEVLASGLEPRQVYFAQMAPTARTLIQGEIQQADINDGRHGLELLYSTVRKPMRDALAESQRFVSGIIARELLRHYMDAGSFDWMNVLLERYPGHVIEFSVYDCCFGTVSSRNTIWWEVRRY